MTHTDVLLAILQSTPDYVLAVRREGYELIWANRAFCDYCRQSHGIEMTPGLSFSGLPGAREAEPIWHEWFERVSREGNFSTEYIVPESGTSLQLTLSLLGDQLDPQGVSVIARDISAQRQMEARLAVNESLYSSLVNAMAEGAVFQAADGRIVALNPAAERIEGRSRDDMLGKTSDDPGWGAVRDDGSPFPGEEHPAMVTLRTGKALSDVVMGIRQPSGERRWISINSEPVYSQGGPLPDAVVTTFHDITQQRAVEADLRVAAIAFEQSQEAMLITDADMKILKVNRAFSEITGYAMEDAIGQTPRLLSSGLQDQDFYRALWDEVASSDHWQGEIWNRRKSGELYPEWLSINAVRDEQGRLTHYVGTFLDLSEHKEAEATIHTLTYNDALTGLPNRHFLLMRLQELLAGTVRSRQSALLFVDLDDFKLVNEALGHATADRLLAACARAMRAAEIGRHPRPPGQRRVRRAGLRPARGARGNGRCTAGAGTALAAGHRRSGPGAPAGLCRVGLHRHYPVPQ